MSRLDRDIIFFGHCSIPFQSPISAADRDITFTDHCSVPFQSPISAADRDITFTDYCSVPLKSPISATDQPHTNTFSDICLCSSAMKFAQPRIERMNVYALAHTVFTSCRLRESRWCYKCCPSCNVDEKYRFYTDSNCPFGLCVCH